MLYSVKSFLKNRKKREAGRNRGMEEMKKGGREGEKTEGGEEREVGTEERRKGGREGEKERK